MDVALERTRTAESDIEELHRRIATLERGRWPLPSLAALVGLAALLVSLYEVLTR
ncbi:hypothetical protein [Streptomyces sp. URMC 124]|uniref:hypothetical protein n=1 Tax=Streptomyces sp. URMC 124 TaxID=3423405 RepID=UPI003F1E360E